MSLFQPAWKSKNKRKALRALEAEKDQVKLAEIAKNAPLTEVRKLAAGSLTSYSVLVEVEKNDNFYVVKEAAREKRKDLVEKITDQIVIADIAKTDFSSYIRGIALQRLTDQSVIEDLAINSSHMDVRMSAIKRITNKSTRDQLAFELCERGFHFWKMDENHNRCCSQCGYIDKPPKKGVSTLLSEARDMGLDCSKGSHYWDSPEPMPQYHTGYGVRCLICGRTEIYDVDA